MLTVICASQVSTGALPFATFTVRVGQEAEGSSPVCAQTVTLSISPLLTSKSLLGRFSWILLMKVFHIVAAGLPLAEILVGVL